jgi:predicted MFS family arabinose efflux permease
MTTGSLTTGSFLLRGSSSRVLRVSFYLRSVAAAICALAFPGNPAALPMLVLGSALFNGAGNAGALASNERLYRLAPADHRVRCQSYYVGFTSAAFAVGAVGCGAALAVSGVLGWPVYTALFVGAGVSRAIAGLRTDVSPSWQSPFEPPTDQI